LFLSLFLIELNFPIHPAPRQGFVFDDFNIANSVFLLKLLGSQLVSNFVAFKREHYCYLKQEANLDKQYSNTYFINADTEEDLVSFQAAMITAPIFVKLSISQ
jgi:hypothetical protein